jgi:hypothetical protein
VIGAVLGVSAVFAVLARTADIVNKDFSFETYIEHITENVQPFPDFPSFNAYTNSGNEWEMIKGFFSWIGNAVAFPVKCAGVVLHNVTLLFDGFLDFGSIDENGEFAGGGHGGGGGGGR